MVGYVIYVCILSFALLSCLILYIRLRSSLSRLSQSADAFLTEGGDILPYSVSEDALAPIQNVISDLQSRILLLENMKNEAHLTAEKMLSDISHQLKTPLASVRLFTEMDAGVHMDIALTQIERMENLIGALLKLERLCSGGYPFAFEETDMREIITDAWNSVSPAFPGRTIEITGSAVLRADRRWMSEAYMNLFKNALEHMDENGVLQVTVENGENAFFSSVTDTGGGVQKEELAHIFERFYTSKVRESNGCGIGLSLTKEIIRRHHGTIQAENTENGLRMNLCIPVMNLSKS